MHESIRFYRVQEEHGELSNFAPFPVELDGQVWPTSEHYYQAQKFVGTPCAEEIRAAESPGRAKRMSRDRKSEVRPDWESVKDGVMRKVVLAKFTQHGSLRALLLATGERPLVEHTWSDRYWADGGDGRGKNMLGMILMEVRGQLRTGASPSGQ